MAISFHAGINLGKNELQNARVQNLANSAQPSSPVQGQIYFDTDNLELTVYNGSQWEGVGAYTLPTATASVLGGVKIDNSTIGISSGVISVKDSGITNAKISASADIALSKLADIADDTILGNVSGSAAAPSALTATQVRTMINVADGATANAGTVTSVSGGTGLTGSVSSSGSLSVDYSGTDNIIRAAGDGTSDTIADNDLILFSNGSDAVKRATVSQLPFSNNSGTVTTVTSSTTNQLTVANGSSTPALSIVTAAIANGGTGLATADQIHTFVTTQTDSMAASTTGNAGSVTVTANSDDTAYSLVFETSNSILKDGSASDQLKYNPGTQTLTVKNITVAGTQTINNTQLINTSNGVVFEGATADDFETSLVATDPTADRTITLPNHSGEVAIFGTGSQGKITASSAEINILAGSNVSATEFGYLDGVTSAIQTQLNTKGTMSSFVLEDGDGTEVTIGNGKEVKFIEGGGIDINWTDTSNGSDADPYDLTFSVTTATASAKGIAELATASEVQAGTDATRIVTPDTLASRSVHATIDVSDSNFTTNLYAAIQHDLGTEDVIVQCFDSSTKETVYADVARTDKSGTASTNHIKISFGRAPSNDIEVMITSIKGSTAVTRAYA